MKAINLWKGYTVVTSCYSMVSYSCRWTVYNQEISHQPNKRWFYSVGTLHFPYKTGYLLIY